VLILPDCVAIDGSGRSWLDASYTKSMSPPDGLSGGKAAKQGFSRIVARTKVECREVTTHRYARQRTRHDSLAAERTNWQKHTLQ